MSRASSLPATAITCMCWESRTTLTAATSKPASWVIPSAMTSSASCVVPSAQLVDSSGAITAATPAGSVRSWALTTTSIAPSTSGSRAESARGSMDMGSSFGDMREHGQVMSW